MLKYRTIHTISRRRACELYLRKTTDMKLSFPVTLSQQDFDRFVKAQLEINPMATFGSEFLIDNLEQIVKHFYPTE